MSQINVIEHFFKTFYPQVKIHIHIQWEDHFSMNRETNWLYEVEMTNIVGLIYNPMDFSPIYKLNEGQLVDLNKVYYDMMNFIPHLVSRISVFYMSDGGLIHYLEQFEEPHRSF